MSEHDHGFSRREDHCLKCGGRSVSSRPRKINRALLEEEEDTSLDKICVCQFKENHTLKIKSPLSTLLLIIGGLTAAQIETHRISEFINRPYSTLTQDYSISQDIRWAPFQASSSVIGSVTQGSSVSLPWSVIMTGPDGKVQGD